MYFSQRLNKLDIEDRIFTDFGLRPVVASEIEFYLFASDGCDLAQFWSNVRTGCAENSIEIYSIEKERGHEQQEISITPSKDIKKIAADTEKIKQIISETAAKNGMQASFAAKPLADDFGSGLHIHVHLEDASGKNQFFKNDELISDALKYSLGGLLLWMPNTMPIFAPHEESYRRFAEGSNAPLTVSWGANNRTVALRLPDSEHGNKRIEHRIAGADADSRKVINAILAAIHYGLKNKCQPNEQIYGDARLDRYNLQKFPVNLSEAQKLMKNSPLPLADYFS